MAAGSPRRGLLAGLLLAGIVLGTGACRGSAGDPAGDPDGATGAGPAPSAGVPGAAGLGDPYFPGYGNGGYQVDHYDLAVGYDPASQQLTGYVTAHATATQELAAFNLDLATSLTVGEVTVDGAAAEFAHHAYGTGPGESDKLMVTPAASVPAGTGFEVAVSYAGVPEPVTDPQLGSNGFHHTDDGAFAIGQPRSASTWFPVNDHPSDKATYDIEITVPDGLVAVSNGVPTGETPAAGPDPEPRPEPGAPEEPPGDWVTWGWSERAPMASYLAVLAIGDYRVHESEHDGRPVVVAVHADLPTDVDDQLVRTAEIADGLAGWFGPYPFEAYGGIALADQRIRFALETQSRPIYGPGFFSGFGGEPQDATWVIVHELAHQWFGNSVSLAQWSDMWLNEGFATYAEWLWEEEDGGDTLAESFDLHWEGPGAEPGFWTVPPGDPGPERLFDSAVYVRGAMTLHALRLAVGDDTFFQIVRDWAGQREHGHGTTDEFITLSEQVAGESLESLFNVWLYALDRPEHPGPS